MNKTSTRNINKSPMVVKKPTGRSGGTNASVSAVKNPTKYTGGKQTPPKGATPGKPMPKGKLTKKK